jgi:hypothetical protein
MHNCPCPLLFIWGAMMDDTPLLERLTRDPFIKNIFHKD